MKPNTEKDFWHYYNDHGHIVEVYCIDGVRRAKHSSAQYLMETYNMNMEEAYHYVNNVMGHI